MHATGSKRKQSVWMHVIMGQAWGEGRFLSKCVCVCVCVYEDELLVCVTVKIIIVHRSRFI